MKFVIAMLLTCVSVAQAQTIGLHIGSIHVPDTYKVTYPDGGYRIEPFNNFNPGGYVKFDNGITAGAYVNSYSRGSNLESTVYAGYTFDVSQHASLLVAVARMERRLMPTLVTPLLVPSVKLPWGLRLSALPPAEKEGAFVMHLSWEYKL